MKKIRLSFQLRLYLYILLFILVIFGSIAVVFFFYGRKVEEKNAILYTQAQQNIKLQKLEDELSTVEISVRSVIEQQKLFPKRKKRKMLKFAGQLIKDNPLMLGVGYIDLRVDTIKYGSAHLDYIYEDDRDSIVHNCIPKEKYDYTKMSWYKAVLQNRQGEWTEPYIDNTGTHQAIVSYVMAMRDTLDRVIGVVVADVALDSLAAKGRGVKPFEDSYSFILSKNGVVIFHPNTQYTMKEDIFSLGRRLHDDNYKVIGHHMLTGKGGYLRSELDGDDVLICYAPIPHVGWSVASVSTYSDIMSKIDSITFTILFILIIGIVLLLLCLRILVINMVRPIRQMTDAAYLIAKGDFNTSMPKMSNDDEFGKLRNAFVHMQDNLKTYIKNLKSATAARERINGELMMAHRIQMEMIPSDFVLTQGYENIDIDAFLTPARKVGGDFYDFDLKDGKIFFTIGDVSGKGMAAAMVMSMTCTLFRSLISKHDSPSEMMGIINEALLRNNQTNIFVTMFLAVLDTNTGEMVYCNAGHNAPYLFSETEGCSNLPMHPKLPLGLFGNVNYMEEKYTMHKGQSLLLYTDGLTEAENTEKNQMGTQRLEHILDTISGKTSHEIITTIREQLRLFVGKAEQSDDLTIFAINYASCKTLIMDNKIQEIEKLPAFIKALGEEAMLTKPQMMSLRLVLEEALVNIISYAYPKGESGKINLKALYEPRESYIRIELTDKGKPFNPTKTKEVDLTLSAEERPVGGLGIFLIKKHVDEVNYEYQNGMNKLMMVKRLHNNNIKS